MSHRRLALAVVISAALAAAACGSDPSAVPPPGTVEVRATGCSAVDTLATGATVGEGRVLTVAHALHGADTVSVDGHPAHVVALDDRLDAAVVAVDGGGLAADAVALAARASPGPARVVTRSGTDATRVNRVVEAQVDVDGGGVVDRKVLELALPLEAGDSGAPVVDSRGRLIGMVFATSREGNRSYAVSVDELAPFVAATDSVGRGTASVDLGACR